MDSTTAVTSGDIDTALSHTHQSSSPPQLHSASSSEPKLRRRKRKSHPGSTPIHMTRSPHHTQTVKLPRTISSPPHSTNVHTQPAPAPTPSPAASPAHTQLSLTTNSIGNSNANATGSTSHSNAAYAEFVRMMANIREACDPMGMEEEQQDKPHQLNVDSTLPMSSYAYHVDYQQSASQHDGAYDDGSTSPSLSMSDSTSPPLSRTPLLFSPAHSEYSPRNDYMSTRAVSPLVDDSSEANATTVTVASTTSSPAMTATAAAACRSQNEGRAKARATANSASATPLRFVVCLLTALPSALLHRVLEHVDASSLVAVSRCCRLLNPAANDYLLWSTLYVRRWRVSTPRTRTDWKGIYRKKEEEEMNIFMQDTSRTHIYHPSPSSSSPSSSPSSTSSSLNNDPLAASLRAMQRARASVAQRRFRRRDEFALIDAWKRENREVCQAMMQKPGGMESHAPVCSRERCDYTHYPPDLYICQQTGLVHFCGPWSDEPSLPIHLPSHKTSQQETNGAKSENEAIPTTSTSSTLSPTAQTSSSSSSPLLYQPEVMHTCFYLEPSSGPSSFHVALLSVHPHRLLTCPISGRLNEQVEDDGDGAMAEAEDEGRRVRGGSPEPDDSCGRGSFLIRCFEHGYHAETLMDATAVWSGEPESTHRSSRPTLQLGVVDASGIRRPVPLQVHAERQVIRQGRKFGEPIGPTTGIASAQPQLSSTCVRKDT